MYVLLFYSQSYKTTSFNDCTCANGYMYFESNNYNDHAIKMIYTLTYYLYLYTWIVVRYFVYRKSCFMYKFSSCKLLLCKMLRKQIVKTYI